MYLSRDKGQGIFVFLDECLCHHIAIAYPLHLLIARYGLSVIVDQLCMCRGMHSGVRARTGTGFVIAASGTG